MLIAVEVTELFKLSAANSRVIPEALASTVSEYVPTFINFPAMYD